MRINVLNNLILKNYNSKNSKLFVDKLNNNVYVTDSYTVWIINEQDFIFDITKFKERSISKIVKDVYCKVTLDGYLSNNCKKENKTVFRQIINKENNVIVTVNEKNLKCFNDDCTFKILDDHTPILVYEDEELIGMVCPVKS